MRPPADARGRRPLSGCLRNLWGQNDLRTHGAGRYIDDHHAIRTTPLQMERQRLVTQPDTGNAGTGRGRNGDGLRALMKPASTAHTLRNQDGQSDHTRHDQNTHQNNGGLQKLLHECPCLS
ncbi:Hypothetical protein GbCGDNIH9_8738 [Granulibacter bethesdensis]|uniref:Uncharacterized protein n=1 Tax=Granulibacter bethesdensis TaxID=364410 RepID=A0AAC9K9K2_9PROT|nr:Hypothetical protein GbCGDNIH9_8738 [Granulibacter bethesdensis]